MSSRTLRSNRSFGVEIEAYGVPAARVAAVLTAAGIRCDVQTYNHRTANCWKVVPDSSITGEHSFELVSPVLSGAAGLAEVRKVCGLLDVLNVNVNKSCGVHVHHDARDLSLAQWKNVVKSYLKYERAFDTIVAASRRDDNNTYCRSLRNRFATLRDGMQAVNTATTLEQLAQIVVNNDRYYKLNLMAFWRHGTVEFRQHGGTISAEKICQWIILTNGFIEENLTLSVINAVGADQLSSLLWFVHVSKTTVHFFTERAAAFAAAA